MYKCLPLLLIILCGCSSLEHRSDKIAKKPLVQSVASKHPIWRTRPTQGNYKSDGQLALSYDPDAMYVTDSQGTVAALTHQGHLIWQQNTQTRITTGASVHDHTLFVGTSDGRLIRLQAKDGRIYERHMRASSEILAQPSIQDDLIVVHTLDGGITAYDSHTGQQVWRYLSTENNLVMRIASTPVITSRHVIVGLGNGKLIAIDKESGDLHWEKSLGQSQGSVELNNLVDVSSTPIVENNRVYAVSAHGKLIALEESSGVAHWEKNISSLHGLTVTADHVFLADTNGVIWALDKKSGQTIWQQSTLTGRRFTKPLAHQDHLILGDEDGYLYWIDQKDGHLLAADQVTTAEIKIAPQQIDGTIVALATDGTLVAYSTK